MIIEKVIIENYLCYFGKKTIELADGLNIILGENGEGKTKFFEAIEWLFDGDNRNLDFLISKKAIDNAEIDKDFKVEVAVFFKKDRQKYVVTKSFLVKKNENGTIDTYNYGMEGIEETNSGERSQVDGKALLNRIFPFEIRKYSMFKGESELDIFKYDDALINLINLFSDARYYEKYAAKGAYLREQANSAVEASAKLDKKNVQEYKGLEHDINSLEFTRKGLLTRITLNQDETRRLEQNIHDAGKYVHNATELETINKRIQNIENEISKLSGLIDEGYTTKLFDEKWINIYFEPYLNEFTSKIADFSSSRRKLQSEYDQEIGIKKGEKKAKADLLNRAIPLPINVPSKAVMEEMLHDEICKVCNRVALKGSEAYEFMYTRLQEYLESQVIDNNTIESEKPLFIFDYASKLVQMSSNHEDSLKDLRNVKEEIKELFEFNEKRKADIENQENKLELEIQERNRVLGNSKLAAEKLKDIMVNYTSWQNELTSSNKENVSLTIKLAQIDGELKIKRDAKGKIDLKSASNFLVKTRDILNDIESIFIDTKELKFDEFINKLEEKSNQYLKVINVNSFTGKIVFSRKKSGVKELVNIDFYEDGKPFLTPNQSLETSKHLSVLFAISEIASETREELYPMIFDAPISSFAENKSGEFLNLLFETKGQKILLIKDFLVTDRKNGKLTVKKEFDKVKRNKAFWVCLKRPFDSESLKTIDSDIITL
jgi:DNA sulfur modification protein DndD